MSITDIYDSVMWKIIIILEIFITRDIMLGEQDEPVYETTNNNDIALAFREAKFEIWEIIKILTETEKAYDCGYI